MGPFRDFSGNEHWGIEIVDADLDERETVRKRKNAASDTVSAGELIELQTKNHLEASSSSQDQSVARVC